MSSGCLLTPIATTSVGMFEWLNPYVMMAMSSENADRCAQCNDVIPRIWFVTRLRKEFLSIWGERLEQKDQLVLNEELKGGDSSEVRCRA